MTADRTAIDERIARIARFPFRAKFHLRPQELDYLSRRGLPAMREHAREFVMARLAPAQPARDGKQTPWGGHPVFRAQHATGTCCRGCLARNHGIRAGHDLTEDEVDEVVDVICRWIELDLAQAGIRPPAQPQRPGRDSRPQEPEPPTQPPLF